MIIEAYVTDEWQSWCVKLSVLAPDPSCALSVILPCLTRVRGLPHLQMALKCNVFGDKEVEYRSVHVFIGLPPDETQLHLHMKKDSFVFIWYLSQCLWGNLDEARYHCISRAASQLGKGGLAPWASV